jgi:myo-inositol-1-phosphate synthase
MKKKIQFVNTTVSKPRSVASVKGKLGILMPGMGAVASTFIAGVLSTRKGLGKPIGSLTQMATIRLGKRTEHRNPLIKDFVELPELSDLVFGGWDIFADNMYQASVKAGVLESKDLLPIKGELERIKPMAAVFDPAYVSRISGPNIKKGKTKMDLAKQLMADMAQFKKTNRCSRLVIVWCGSTEKFQKPASVHQSLAAFELGLESNSPDIAPSQIYAYAALKSGVPYANGAPNLAVDTLALQELAEKNGVPICGKDFKTGQTFMKTVLAPAFKARMLGMQGWFSANILGNRDGEVLDDPDAFKTKEESKLSVLDSILEPELHPDLYGNVDHRVRITYYPPRGDNKEGWDNIDIFGWLGYPMQIKINFLCRDSILAAPLVLDLALFLDLAQRAKMSGIQEWLSFYFKSPMAAPGLAPEHDLFIQLMKLKNTLRWLQGEELITHLGIEYYD